MNEEEQLVNMLGYLTPKQWRYAIREEFSNHYIIFLFQ